MMILLHETTTYALSLRGTWNDHQDLKKEELKLVENGRIPMQEVSKPTRCVIQHRQSSYFADCRDERFGLRHNEKKTSSSTSDSNYSRILW